MLIQFANPDVPKLQVVGNAVILQTDISFKRAVFHGSFAEIHVDDLLPIELEFQMGIYAGDYHSIPLVRWA